MIGAETNGLLYAAGGRCWWRWFPCETCGGTRLPIQDPAARPDLRRSCPNCETRRRRLEPAGADPAVWYDAWIKEWALRIPCPGLRGGVLWPLGIRWIDAPWAEVYRAACDVVYAGDELVWQADAL